MVGSGKCSFAEPALERPVAGVLSGVSGQLVGSGKPPAAALEIALVGLLSRVGSLVGL